MAGLYLDHNISLHLRPALVAAGHDLLFSRDISAARLTDDAHLLLTVQIGRIFITHNRVDFRLLHDAWTTWPAAFGMELPPHPGILVLDAAPHSTLAMVLVDFLAATRPAQLANGLFWWHRHDGWRRPGAEEPWVPFALPTEE